MADERARRLERQGKAGDPEAEARARREKCRAEGHDWAFVAALETTRLPGRIRAKICKRCDETSWEWDRDLAPRCQVCRSPVAVRTLGDGHDHPADLPENLRWLCRSCMVDLATAAHEDSVRRFHLVRSSLSGRRECDHAWLPTLTRTLCGFRVPKGASTWTILNRSRAILGCGRCNGIVQAEQRRRAERDHRIGDPYWGSPVHVDTEDAPGEALCEAFEPDEERFYRAEALLAGVPFTSEELAGRVRPCPECMRILPSIFRDSLGDGNLFDSEEDVREFDNTLYNILAGSEPVVGVVVDEPTDPEPGV